MGSSNSPPGSDHVSKKTLGNISYDKIVITKKQDSLSQISLSDWLLVIVFASFCLLSVHPARKAALHYRALETGCVSLSVPALKHSEGCLDKMG